MPARLVVLASGSGTTLQALLDAEQPEYRIVAVGADRPGIAALQRAERAGLPTFVADFAATPDRARWDAELADRIASFEPDLVVLAGFMRILAPDTVRRFDVVNTHPSLLPAFPGVGIRAVRAALAAGVRVAGVTVHRVDAGVDTGPILAQAAVPVEPGDDEHTLFERIKSAEKPLYVSTIRHLCRQLSEEMDPQ